MRDQALLVTSRRQWILEHAEKAGCRSAPFSRRIRHTQLLVGISHQEPLAARLLQVVLQDEKFLRAIAEAPPDSCVMEVAGYIRQHVQVPYGSAKTHRRRRQRRQQLFRWTVERNCRLREIARRALYRMAIEEGLETIA